MARSPWPIRVGASYMALTIVAWVLILTGTSVLGVNLALVLAIPWSILLADSSGSSTTALMLFGMNVLNATIAYSLLRLVLRWRGASHQGSAAA